MYRIPLTESKQKHVFGVADFMSKYAEQYGLDPDKMFLLGLLHDVGYTHGQIRHEQTGADIIEKCGMDENMVFAIRHHGDDLYEVEKRYKEIPMELVLLVLADMRYNRLGEDVGFEGRLEELRNSYNDVSVAENNIKYLNEFFEKYNGLSAI